MNETEKEIRYLNALWENTYFDGSEAILKKYAFFAEDVKGMEVVSGEAINSFLKNIPKEHPYEGLTEDTHFGLFLSDIINNHCHVKELQLNLPCKRIDYLGIRKLRNKLTINVPDGVEPTNLFVQMKGGEIIFNGNAGTGLCAYMKGGKVIVNGSAEDWIGSNGWPKSAMRGGEIIINGNAGVYGTDGNKLCPYMLGGKVTVKGDANKEIGPNMFDGEIIIEGNVSRKVGFSQQGGKIIVKKDVNSNLAAGMRGGEIIVMGNVKGNIGQTEVYELFIGPPGPYGKSLGKIEGTVSGIYGGTIRIYGDDFKPEEQIVPLNRKHSTEGKLAKVLYKIRKYCGIVDENGWENKDIYKGEIYWKDELVWKDGKLL